MLNGSLSALNTCLGNLQFAPSTDFEGTASLSISATPDTDFQYFSQTNHYYYQYLGSEAPYRTHMTRIFTNMKFATLDGYVLTLECQSEEISFLTQITFHLTLAVQQEVLMHSWQLITTQQILNGSIVMVLKTEIL